jgi:hypothetical protein
MRKEGPGMRLSNQPKKREWIPVNELHRPKGEGAGNQTEHEMAA